MRVALVCLLSTVTFGQLSFRGEPNGGFTVIVDSSALHLGQPLAGEPYSAEWVEEHVYTLANGAQTKLPAQKPGKMWRDSQGLTRSERFIVIGPQTANRVTMIEVRDDVSGNCYVLDPLAQVAHRLTLTRQQNRAPETTSPPPGIGKSLEKLGTRIIDGILAEGTRMTNTVVVGDTPPLVFTTEQWDSPELRVTLFVKQFDPRIGELRTTRMTTIARAEPDPSLFRIPAGYSVVDEKESFRLTVEK
jgi:hypothetical protein